MNKNNEKKHWGDTEFGSLIGAGLFVVACGLFLFLMTR